MLPRVKCFVHFYNRKIDVQLMLLCPEDETQKSQITWPESHSKEATVLVSVTDDTITLKI